jgi:transglutaminase-like putative cysteine protease
MMKFFRLQEGWLTVGLVAMMLFSVTLSIEQAQWSDGLSILTPITLIGMITGLVLAKVRGVPRFLLDLVGLMIGVNTVLIAVASVMHDPRLSTVQDRVQDLVLRTTQWLNVSVRGDMNDDIVVFILSLAVVSWVLAYSSSYFIFRSRQLWWALVPNGVALLINISYSLVNLNGYLIVFMFSALLLMIRFNLLLKEERWQRERVNYSPRLTWAFLWAGSALSIAVALLMWYVPATAVNNTLNNVWSQVNKPWLDFQDLMSRQWGAIDGAGGSSFGGYSSFNDSFVMGGQLNLSDNVALVVKSTENQYWRVRTWDEYTGMGWRNTAKDTFTISKMSPLLTLNANDRLPDEDASRHPVTYTVQVVNPKDDLLFAPSRPVEFDRSTYLEYSWRPLTEVYNVEKLLGDQLAAVPPELREHNFIGLLQLAQRELRSNTAKPCTDADTLNCLFDTTQGPQLLDDIRSLKDDRGIDVNLSLSPAPGYVLEMRPAGEVSVYEDLTSVHNKGDQGPEPIKSGDEYTAVSMVSNATDDELRADNTDYASWLTDRYLKVPVKVPAKVASLARQIVSKAKAVTPFDKAKAIETYLRANYTYNTNITPPNNDEDRIYWFLFEGKEGYCEYYAGAMVVMLRDLGVPTRLAGGYAPGTYDPQTGEYTIRESSAHAWPEVYFPTYGWVAFEPTPSQAVIAHDVPQAQPTFEPTVEPTTGPQTSATPNDGHAIINQPPASAGTTSGGGLGVPGGAWGWGVLGFAALAAGLFFFLPASPFKKRRAAASAGFYYKGMLFWARLLRAGPAPHQTPYEFSEALARDVPGTSLYARTIARAYVREQFGRDPLASDERRNVGNAYNGLRSKLARNWPRRRVRRILRKDK